MSYYHSHTILSNEFLLIYTHPDLFFVLTIPTALIVSLTARMTPSPMSTFTLQSPTHLFTSLLDNIINQDFLINQDLKYLKTYQKICHFEEIISVQFPKRIIFYEFLHLLLLLLWLILMASTHFQLTVYVHFSLIVNQLSLVVQEFQQETQYAQ